jgi:hypothetical protein
VNHCGVADGDDRPMNTAAATNKSSITNVRMRPTFDDDDRREGGWNCGSDVASPHL